MRNTLFLLKTTLGNLSFRDDEFFPSSGPIKQNDYFASFLSGIFSISGLLILFIRHLDLGPAGYPERERKLQVIITIRAELIKESRQEGGANEPNYHWTGKAV